MNSRPLIPRFYPITGFEHLQSKAHVSGFILLPQTNLMIPEQQIDGQEQSNEQQKIGTDFHAKNPLIDTQK
jgi:hypothetical protein